MTETVRRRRKKTKNRIAATDYSETVQAILYRLGGATAEQVARWLVLVLPGEFEGRARPQVAALDVARKTLRTMREAGLVEAISIRRTWLGKRAGRREDFYRLSRGRGGQAILDGALAADQDGKRALAAYRRPWKSGGIDHAAHRGDYYLLLAEEAEIVPGLHVDPERMFSETHPGFPLYGARTPALDSGGEKLSLKTNARRKYEEITPDGEFWIEWPDEDTECPYLIEIERRTNAREVEAKIQKYAGYWLRRWRKFGEVLIRPIVVVHHDTRPAGRRREGAGAFGMRQTLRDRLYSGGHFAALQAALQAALAAHDPHDPRVDVGRMVLLCEWEHVYGLGAFSEVYYPVGQYASGGGVTDDGWTGGLEAAETERAALLDALGAGPG